MRWESVWYRGSPGTGIPAYEDKGTLDIADGTMSFAGKKQSASGRIRSVDREQMGTNRWIHVQYEAEGGLRDAYFMNSGLLGWAGMLGGNKRLAEELKPGV